MVKLFRNEKGQIKVLEGEVQLVNEDGSEIRHHKSKFSICGCGRSKSILCDGSHNLNPCGCGRSETGYCSGLHSMTTEEYVNYLNTKN